ncbi:MAG: bestrophin family ion channel [Bacteroidota bacterium]|nr:bestrophin family ion channel [Bacteroidota bacterium]
MAFEGKRPPLWVSVLFDYHNTPTLRRILYGMLAAGLYTLALDYLENYQLHVDFKPPVTIFSLMGTVLGLLLVFRTNTAYDRWWSGRILLSNLTNSTRNMALKINAYLSPDDIKNRKFFATMIANHAYAMKENLRDGVKFDELEDVDGAYMERMKKCYHVPNEIVSIMNERITELYQKGILADPQLLELNKHTDIATDVNGSCERIRTSPVPFSYSLHLKKFIFFFTLILPFGLIHDLDFWSVPIVMVIFYALAGLEAIGEEIEDPFGLDENDLPLDKICKSIKTSVKALLRV